MYRVLTMNCLRFQAFPRDAQKACERWRSEEEEDVNHYLWSYPEVNDVWRWVHQLVLTTKPSPQPTTHLTVAQALVGEPIEEPNSPPIKWWRALRGAA